MFFDELILIILLMSCDCGPAGKPIGAHVYMALEVLVNRIEKFSTNLKMNSDKSMTREGRASEVNGLDVYRNVVNVRIILLIIEFYLKFYFNKRNYFSQAVKLSSKLVIEKIVVKYLNKNPGLETIFLNEIFQEFSENCDKIFKRTKNLELKTYYSPKYKISVIKITFEDLLNKNKLK
jgi:hypothetical protein